MDRLDKALVVSLILFGIFEIWWLNEWRLSIITDIIERALEMMPIV